MVVAAIAVGAFHHEHVKVAQHVRVLDHGHVGPADVAGKAETQRAAVLNDFERHTRRPENMPRVAEGDGDAGDRRKGPAVGHGPEFVHARLRVLHGVQRLKRRVVLLALLRVDKFNVLELEMGRVTQHDAAQVDGGRCRVNGPAEPLFHQVRDVAAVVHVRVRQYQAV